MNPILQSALGSILRHFLTGWAAYLVTKGIWTAGDMTTYVEAAVLALLGLGWALWQKYRTHITILAALDAPAGTSLHRLAEIQKIR